MRVPSIVATMQTHAVHRWLAHLALCAALLLVALPTAGRVLGAVADGAAHVHVHAAHLGGFGPTAGDAGLPAPVDDAADDDCGYCPLLASLAPVASCTAAFTAGAVAVLPLGATPAHRGRRHPCGLGSRGRHAPPDPTQESLFARDVRTAAS